MLFEFDEKTKIKYARKEGHIYIDVLWAFSPMDVSPDKTFTLACDEVLIVEI